MKPTEYENLFKPLKVNGMDLKNRMVMPPMGTLFGNPTDGAVTDRLKGYFEARARGGVGLMIVEYTAVSPEGRASIRQLGIWNDRFIKGLSELNDIAHQYSVKTSIQLHHAGREAAAAVCASKPLAPSPVAGSSALIPSELSVEQIKDLVNAFAQGARRAKEAGFDCVEIHGAHGYLVSQFMTPFANKRTDHYGGDIEGFAAFPVEIVEAVRAVVGPDFPILFRISGDEHVKGGRNIDDSVIMAKKLVEAGIDLLDISAGLLQSGEWIIPSAIAEPGLHVNDAAVIRQAAKIPVIAVGKIHSPKLAEKIVASGQADLVALGRALLVDPDFPNKLAEGRSHEIRHCIHCLQGCYNDPVQCTQNPELGFEWSKVIRPAELRKKVFIIGSGPAGLEAARIAALRDHQVTVYEKESEPGGQVKLACIPPGKIDLKEVIDWRLKELEGLNVKLKLGIEFSVDMVVGSKPDIIVVATGGVPLKPPVAGLEKVDAVFAWDILKETESPGEEILIIGAGSVGAETADYLQTHGKKVALLDMLPEIAKEVPYANRLALLERLRGTVEIMLSTEIIEAKENTIIVIANGKKRVLTGYDQIILAAGVKPVNDLHYQISREYPEVDLYLIGDARKPRRIIDALAEGNRVGHLI